MNKHTNTKNEIDQAVAEVIKARINKDRIMIADDERLLAFRAKIIEDIKNTNTPIRTWIKKLFKKS